MALDMQIRFLDLHFSMTINQGVIKDWKEILIYVIEKRTSYVLLRYDLTPTVLSSKQVSNLNTSRVRRAKAQTYNATNAPIWNAMKRVKSSVIAERISPDLILIWDVRKIEG